MSFRDDDRTRDNGEHLSDGFRSIASAGVSHVATTSLADRVQILLAAQEILAADFANAADKGDINTLKKTRETLRVIEQGTGRLKKLLDEQLFNDDIRNIRELFSKLDDPEVPGIGLAFLKKLDETGCKIVAGENLTAEQNSLKAVYTSYSYGKETRGFINEIAVNKFKLEDVLALMDSIEHEVFHALQKHSAPALHLSPFNPDTMAIIHPLDWIQLEGLCERDAYAKEGLFNWLISKTDPAMRDRSEYDVVSVDDFENALRRYPPIHNALIHVALNALYKSKVEGDDSFLFSHHYQGVAIGNYVAGMAKRMKDGKSNPVFVRLEAHDFYAVGDYGVGPNSLGNGSIDKGFLYRPCIQGADADKLDALYSKYNIPPLEDCPTLGEYNAAVAHQRAQHAHEQRSGAGFAMAAMPC